MSFLYLKVDSVHTFVNGLIGIEDATKTDKVAPPKAASYGVIRKIVMPIAMERTMAG